MYTPEEEVLEWLDQAEANLQVAGELLAGGLAEDTITAAFLAMLYATGAVLQRLGLAFRDWGEAVDVFRREALPRMDVSKENQRALFIVQDLYIRTVVRGETEADPLTAAACLEDARSFVHEMAESGGTSS